MPALPAYRTRVGSPSGRTESGEALSRGPMRRPLTISALIDVFLPPAQTWQPAVVVGPRMTRRAPSHRSPLSASCAESAVVE